MVITKHHGSKAIIKQSSPCQATITMSSNHHHVHQQDQSPTGAPPHHPGLHHHGLHQSTVRASMPSSSSVQGTIKYVGHLHMQSPSEDHHHPSPRLHQNHLSSSRLHHTVTTTRVTHHHHQIHGLTITLWGVY